MSLKKPVDTRNEEFWRAYLANPDSFQRLGRHFFSRIPSNPRCRLCAAPFAGPGAPLMRLLGKRPSDPNPNVCNSCQNFMIRHHGGAELDGSMLFADIRGSTSLAEQLSPGEFNALLNRFYTAASDAVVANDGMIEKFVGDELVATFAPVLAGERHTARAVDAALALLRATGHADPGGPWVPLGAGVNTGRVWFGAVGEGSHVELTVLGDPVNVTARLAAQAAAGEILVSADAAAAAGLDPGLPRTTLELKGKHESTEVVSLRVDAPPPLGAG
ncbi:MAG: adenylate/guanylate cyclase domain-containing protein [Candidatus Limnocylindria bacterium]